MELRRLCAMTYQCIATTSLTQSKRLIPNAPSSLSQDLALWVAKFFLPAFAADAVPNHLVNFHCDNGFRAPL
jgi:hypothetical protein